MQFRKQTIKLFIAQMTNQKKIRYSFPENMLINNIQRTKKRLIKNKSFRPLKLYDKNYAHTSP